jgi:hypothetical protein
MSDLSLHCQRQLNLFRRQYFQLQVAIRYPDPQCLRQEIFQQLLHAELFDEGTAEYQPPHRYQIRVLKELIRRIEESITDWQEEVCISFTICIRRLPLFYLSYELYLPNIH